MCLQVQIVDRHEDLAVFTCVGQFATLVLFVGRQDLFLLNLDLLELLLLGGDAGSLFDFLDGFVLFVLFDLRGLAVDFAFGLCVGAAKILVRLLQAAEALNDILKFQKFI